MMFDLIMYQNVILNSVICKNVISDPIIIITITCIMHNSQLTQSGDRFTNAI